MTLNYNDYCFVYINVKWKYASFSIFTISIWNKTFRNETITADRLET